MVSRVYNESSLPLGRGPSKKNDGETSSALASSNTRSSETSWKPLRPLAVCDRPDAAVGRMISNLAREGR
jgi:hypothetical protein